MARITLTEIEPGDSMDLTATNNMITAITNGTGAGDIDAENIRDGGLDEHNFNDDAATLKPTASGSNRVLFSTDSASVNLGTSVPTAPIQMGGADVVTGPYEYHYTDLSKNRLIVKFSGRYQSGAVITYLKKCHFQLGYSTDYDPSAGTGTWFLIPVTIRRANYHISLTGKPIVGSLTIAHRFFTNIGADETTSLYFGFFAWHDDTSGAPLIKIEKANFYAITERT